MDSQVEKQENITVSAIILKQINFASQQNDVAVISEIIVKNNTDKVLEDLKLQLHAEPSILQSRSWTIDRLYPQAELRVQKRSVQLSAEALQKLTERMNANIYLQLFHGNEKISTFEHELAVLARNEWGGADYMPELLAAFVTPNDPAVDTVLKEASEVLRRAGEHHAVEGYQSKSRKRVYTLASAIWSAVAAKRLTYAEPPASFERFGQKLRSPSQIWERGLATCLDTTVLFAAALEQAGLNPVIAFTKGHAFCGVWLQPQHFPALTTDDCVEVRKHIAAKELILFETTLVTHEPPATFRSAVGRGQHKLEEDFEEDFVYALDVKQARHRGISPLPSLDGVKQTALGISETEPVSIGLDAAPDLPAFDFGIEIDAGTEDTPETRLDRWRRKLLDLTKRNRLLNLKPTKTAIRLISPNPAVLEDRLADGEKITVIPFERITGGQGERDPELFRERTGADYEREFATRAMERGQIVADLEAKDLEKGMIELYRKSRADIREGGANTLFLAIGVLRWKQSEDEQSSYRAPLLLLPVKLERKSARSQVKITLHDDEPVFNMTLLEMLRQDFEVSIPALEGELPTDASGIDVPLVWEIVRRAVKEIPGFEVREEVVLSTFSFAKYLMWKDLSDRAEILKKNDLVRHLIDTPRDSYERNTEIIEPKDIDTKIDLKNLYMPLPADSSQIVAVHASGEQNDFILEGPPGTGKSQTISNIIAHNLALGRKVLFVSEKMAALEVVYSRLKQHGLGDFCLELHSNKTNKKAVIDHLAQSWKSRRELTTDEWIKETTRLSELRDHLNSVVREIHRPAESGISPFKAIGRVVRYGDVHRLRLDWGDSLTCDPVNSPERYQELGDLVSKVALAFSEINSVDIDALGIINNVQWSYAWQGQLVSAASNLGRAAAKLLEATRNLQQAFGLQEKNPTQVELDGLSKLTECIEDAVKADHSLAFDLNVDEILEIAETAKSELVQYREISASLTCAVDDELVLKIPADELLARWSKSRSAFFGIKQWQQLSIRMALRSAAGKSKLSPEIDLPKLISMQSCRNKILELEGQVPATLPWNGLSTEVDDLDDRIVSIRKLKAAVSANMHDLESSTQVKKSLKTLFVEGRELLQPESKISVTVETYAQSLANYKEARAAFSSLANSDFSGETLEEIADGMSQIDQLQTQLNAWCRWLVAKREAHEAQLGSLVVALEQKVVESTDALEAFKTAYAYWLAPKLIDDREALRAFSSLAHEEKIRTFGELDQKVSELSVDFIRARLNGNICSPDDPSRPRGYKILSHEMNKQRAHKPVRQLISEMGSVITSLTPCMLMSPLSIAQFLPADADLFDLVVFDEASQITVWDAIGAIARGKNVIVVGDPKQMPPTSFFDRAASEEDEEADTVQDLESILDEALASGVKVHRLTGHYRSRHESLIAFSNHTYYGGDLITYPAADTRESAVTYVQVDGLYQRGKRINEKEAKAVVAEVVRRLTDEELSQHSIGVVTMNTEQQRLINDLLDRERVKNPALEPFFDEASPGHVFVRNLETVQGDERDVILISIGFGPTVPEAKTMSMNFGALNRKGGERRLNVLISRAAEEKMVFASFDPSLIDLTRTSAQAVHDLKHYLEFAQRGPKALGEAVSTVGGLHDYDSDFERAVADGLRRKGWTIHTQIGVSKFRIDLGVVHPDKPGAYLAGIECDGATYHSLPAARDRDRVRHVILENLGWRLLRLWSTDYFINPQASIEALSAKLHALVEEGVCKDAGAENQEAAIITLNEDAVNEIKKSQAENNTLSESQGREPFDDELSDDAFPIENSLERKVSSLDVSVGDEINLYPSRFYDDDYRPTIRTFASDFIENHGPITFRYLANAIAREHGFKRTARKIREVVEASVKGLKSQSNSPDGEVVFWPDETHPEELIPFRGPIVMGVYRQWADLPYPEKLGLAAQMVEKHGADKAPRKMAEALQLKRLAASTRQEFEAIISDVIRRQKEMRE